MKKEWKNKEKIKLENEKKELGHKKSNRKSKKKQDLKTVSFKIETKGKTAKTYLA